MKPLPHLGNAWRRLLAGTAILGLCACAVAQLPKQRPTGSKTTTRQQAKKKESRTVETVKLVDSQDEFWSNPLKNQRAVQGKFVRTGKVALLVEAPSEVRFRNRETLPVIVLRTEQIAIASGMPFDKTAVLTAVDLDQNQVYARLAIPPSERHLDPVESPSEPPQPGMIGEAFEIDAREVLELPWKRTRYLLTLILRDKQTAPMLVSLQEPEGDYKDPEVIKFREQERNRPDVPAVWPAPNPESAIYESGPETPPVPAEAGIAIAAPRLLVIDEMKNCMLRGSFRLPVLPKHVVPAPGAPGGERIRAQFQGKDKVPTAIVPITIVATGSTAAVPFVWRLLVPTYDPIAPDKSGLVTGSFSVDLQKLQNVKELEQTLFIYAFSGEAMAGPSPVAFVSR